VTQHSSAPTSASGRRRRPRKGDLREAAIIDAAWDLLLNKPLSAITIEDLARGAGISRSNFYFYFESKDAVMRTLATRVADEIRDATAPFLDPSIDNIRHAITAYLNRWRDRRPAFRAMAALEETDPALRRFWQDITNELLDEFAAALERAQDAGTALPPPPAAKDLVRVLYAMLWRTGYDFSLHPMTRTQERQLIDALTATFARTIFGTATTT
jgi:AcrR family transcriptional regulator